MKVHQILAFVMALTLVSSFVLMAEKGEIPITTNSKEALDLYLGGRDKLENVEINAAAKYFDQAIKKDPGFALAYLGRAFSGGGFNVFRKNLDKAVSLTNRVSDGEKHFIMYFQASADGMGDKQKKHLDQLVRLFPTDKRVHQLAGRYYAGISEFATAVKHLKKAISIDSKFAPVYNSLGYCQLSLSNFQEAEDAFKTYVKLVPNRPNPYDSYAEFLLKQGRYDESINQYKKAISKDASFVNAYKGIGDNYVFIGDYAKARQSYQKQYDMAPNINFKLGALFWKRISYLHEGDISKAIDAVVEYRNLADKEKLVTNVINSYFQEAFILAENKQLDKATKRQKTGMEMIETASLSKTVKDNLKVNGMMNRLHLLTAKNEIETAISEAERCHKTVQTRNNPNEIKTLNSLMAVLEMKQGNYTRAMDYFANSHQNNPYNWFYMASAYEKMNDPLKAMELTEKIARHNENSLNLAVIRQQAKIKHDNVREKAMK